ncbi:phosphotransferase enzyme family protein [Arsenicibacter rosenii]|nr:phosphotransferase [Arsenicibacter rosenii]
MKPTFPASYSTLCADALAEFLVLTYPFEDVQCIFLSRGVGDTYLVKTRQGRFVLRIYRTSHRSLSHVQAEVALLLALKTANVSVSWPVADRTGETIQSINAVEGIRYAVLFSYAPGESVRMPDDRQLYHLGREMARFHEVSSTIRLPGERWLFDFSTTFAKPLEELKGRFSDNPEEFDWLQSAARLVEMKLAGTDTSTLSTGYCHFDFLPKNMHFDQDTVTFFDFDFMGYGWLVYDLVSFWQHLAIEVYAGRLTPQAYEKAYAGFLGGYRAHRSISDEELALVPYLAIGFWLFYMAFHTTHDQFYSFTRPAQLRVYTSFLRHLAETYWDQQPA